MNNLKIGIQTRSFRAPIKQALHTAAKLGADGVEIDLRRELPAEGLSQTGVRQFRKLLDDLGLRLACVAFPTRRGYDDPNDLERRVLATQTAMKVAYQLGASVVINRIGNVPEETTDDRFGRLVQSLTMLGACGEKYGARLAAQTGTEPPAQLVRLIEAVPTGMIGVDLHPGNLILHGYDADDAAEVLGKWVHHVHASDAVRDLGQQRGIEVELGRGSANIPDLLGQLEQFDYRGWVTIERLDSANPVEEIGNAVAFLRSL